MSDSSEKYIITIDLGTSGPKSALVSIHGEVVDWEFEETRVLLLPEGGAEQIPDEWWNAIKNTLKRLLRKGLARVDDIIAVSCTSQWSGTVAVDREGNHLANAIIWMDSRGGKYVKEITDGPIKVAGYEVIKLLKWIRLTGGAPAHSGKDPIAHILYIKNRLPKIYQKTFKFLEPKDYINLRLTGKFAASFDSISLHWMTDNRDIENVTYNEGLIRLSTIDGEKLPKLMRAVDILGTLRKDLAEELGLRNDVRVVVGTPDVQCAAIGSGAVRDYEGHYYIGTSSWLTCHVPFKKTDIFHNLASLPSAIPKRFFVANEQETAGACLNFLANNIQYDKGDLPGGASPRDIYKILDKIAEKAPAGSNKVIFTPWLYGERTPVENPFIRAGFFNQSLKTTRGDLIRAVFEGVAYNGKWLLGYVEKFIKQRMDPINMIGGGANSNVWCQIHADVFDRTIRQVSEPIQANMRGAAFLAAVSLGYITFSDIPGLIKIANVFKPNPENRKTYDELFKAFISVYKNNKKIYEGLNRV